VWRSCLGRVIVGEPDGWAALLAEAVAERAAQPGRICRLCVQMLGVTGAGISMVTAAGNRGVVCATDEVSARIEDLQFTLGEGACVDAVQGGTPVIVSDLDQPGDIVVGRWPAFLEGAGTAGVRAVFAFPLRVGAITVGVLDLYRDRSGDLTSGQLAAALMAADATALALLYLSTGHQDSFCDDADGRAAYQMQVHQATGMVKVQAGVTIEEAFLMLRARAFAAGRPVADVAKDVVERRLRFPEEDR
jgi:GAF domain/ANTAR domain